MSEYTVDSIRISSHHHHLTTPHLPSNNEVLGPTYKFDLPGNTVATKPVTSEPKIPATQILTEVDPSHQTSLLPLSPSTVMNNHQDLVIQSHASSTPPNHNKSTITPI